MANAIDSLSRRLPPPWCLPGQEARDALKALRAGGRTLLLRAGQSTRLRASPRHVLFPSDLSPASLASLKQAIALLPGARFTVLHACCVCGEGAMRTAGGGDEALEACRRRTEALWPDPRKTACRAPRQNVRHGVHDSLHNEHRSE